MDTNNATAPDASAVLEVVCCLMAKLIELGIMDTDDAAEIERKVNENCRRSTH